ncbi:MAG: ZIP family metal transporter [Caldilineaceae bacterium]|nr:ZIP family metal transporter [Caldilineaceae bacterium]
MDTTKEPVASPTTPPTVPPTAPPTTSTRRLPGSLWIWVLVPLLLLGAVLAYFVRTGGGLTELAGPPLERITIERITLPEPGVIQVMVVNDGPQEVTIPQVQVDDAYWEYSADPSNTIPRFGRATFTIPYPWVPDETHVVRLITSLGVTFDGEIAAAVETPALSQNLFWHFGLVGFYVGIVPILLGLLWYPVMRRMGRQAMNFVLALTIGLLTYLAIGTWLDALEFAAELPVFWQGAPLVLLVALLTLGVLLAVGARDKRVTRTPLQVSYLIALGIGLHNLGEGLAIGAAYALGEAALGTFLVLGFTLHNITEGVGIAAPLVREQPRFSHFVLLALLAGAPAILGAWIGGFAFSPLWATIFLAVGIGAIVQVIWEVGKLMMHDSQRFQQPLLNWVNLSGVVVGVAVMFFTAFLVKF